MARTILKTLGIILVIGLLLFGVVRLFFTTHSTDKVTYIIIIDEDGTEVQLEQTKYDTEVKKYVELHYKEEERSEILDLYRRAFEANSKLTEEEHMNISKLLIDVDAYILEKHKNR